GGSRWKKTSLRKGILIALSASADGTLYAGTAFDGLLVSGKREPRETRERLRGLSLSSGHDRHFENMAHDELFAINAQNVYSVTIDPRDSQHLILGTNDGGLLGTDDGGATWRDVGDGLLSRAPRKAIFDPN